MNKFLSEAQELYDWLISIRRTIHKQPELAYQEFKTSTLIRAQLDKFNISYKFPFAETGIIASIGNNKSPVIALRAEMDALPIQEETNINFRSEIEGKMHACGHDCHTAMLLTATRILKKYEKDIQGTIKIIFQPAEEGKGGAKKIIDEGILQELPPIENFFAIHVSPYIPSGFIGSKPNVIMAGAGFFNILIETQGAHAALPQSSPDPISISSQLIQTIQTIASRETHPLEPIVISITSIQTNDSYNIIPNKLTLKGTFRTLNQKKLLHIEKRLQEICQQFSLLHNVKITYKKAFQLYPPTINHPKSWAHVQKSLKKIIPKENILEIEPLMLAEDFSYYLTQHPGCFIFLGCKNEEDLCHYGLHHPKFKVDESILPIGVATHIQVAIDYINNFKK